MTHNQAQTAAPGANEKSARSEALAEEFAKTIDAIAAGCTCHEPEGPEARREFKAAVALLIAMHFPGHDDLLAAAKAALKWADEFPKHRDWEFIKQLRSAIAKAGGVA